VLSLGVLRIKEQARMGIVENALGFFKPNSVLGPIASVFRFVPIDRSMSR